MHYPRWLQDASSSLGDPKTKLLFHLILFSIITHSIYFLIRRSLLLLFLLSPFSTHSPSLSSSPSPPPPLFHQHAVLSTNVHSGSWAMKSWTKEKNNSWRNFYEYCLQNCHYKKFTVFYSTICYMSINPSLPAYHCRQWKYWRIFASAVGKGLSSILMFQCTTSFLIMESRRISPMQSIFKLCNLQNFDFPAYISAVSPRNGSIVCLFFAFAAS